MPDALTKLAEGERLLAAACDRGVPLHKRMNHMLVASTWLRTNADALLAGMRALVEITNSAHLDTDTVLTCVEVQVQRDDWKAAQEAVARFTEEQP